MTARTELAYPTITAILRFLKNKIPLNETYTKSDRKISRKSEGGLSWFELTISARYTYVIKVRRT
jgi:hypothetical protein